MYNDCALSVRTVLAGCHPKSVAVVDESREEGREYYAKWKNGKDFIPLGSGDTKQDTERPKLAILT